MFEDDDLMRIAEVAKLGRVTTGTVRRWVAAGKLPCTKVNTRYVFRRGDVLKFLGIER